MLVPDNIKVFIATIPTDMRKSYEGLTAIVHNQFKRDVYESALYVFFNKRRDMIKILWYERTTTYSGFSILMRRLDNGTYSSVKTGGEGPAEATLAELALILESINSRKNHKPERKLL